VKIKIPLRKVMTRATVEEIEAFGEMATMMTLRQHAMHRYFADITNGINHTPSEMNNSDFEEFETFTSMFIGEQRWIDRGSAKKFKAKYLEIRRLEKMHVCKSNYKDKNFRSRCSHFLNTADALILLVQHPLWWRDDKLIIAELVRVTNEISCQLRMYR